jgi:hypothetical protein
VAAPGARRRASSRARCKALQAFEPAMAAALRARRQAGVFVAEPETHLRGFVHLGAGVPQARRRPGAARAAGEIERLCGLPRFEDQGPRVRLQALAPA